MVPTVEIYGEPQSDPDTGSGNTSNDNSFDADVEKKLNNQEVRIGQMEDLMQLGHMILLITALGVAIGFTTVVITSVSSLSNNWTQVELLKMGQLNDLNSKLLDKRFYIIE
ncbi:hypothetical protein COB87_002795 [Candidatus Wolfebacteria bacterium]|nr:hypothetical protein [Candidatus Wolfebacteria bacterium]